MVHSIVRIQKIEIENLKNVESGSIEFKSDPRNNLEYAPKSEIIGVYGQNGSGKTALVNACFFVKRALEGLELPKDLYNYINIFSNHAKISIQFYIERKLKKFIVDYEIEFEKTNEKSVEIVKEKLSYSKKLEKWTNKSIAIGYDKELEEEFSVSKGRYDEIVSSGKENYIDLKVAGMLAKEKKSSFIFNEEAKKVFNNSFKDLDICEIIDTLTYFARCNFFVILNRHAGIISADQLIPFSFRIEETNGIASGDIVLRLNDVTLINMKSYEIISKIISQMNGVLIKIVPGLKVELHNYGEQIDENGNVVLKVELLSIKGDNKIPIKYESEGIKKIISILSAMIAMYNKSSVCMVVDELDAGIYEYLLGEILSVIEDGGKGQLIFTSHNLRPLEILNKDSLYFTTTNPKKRYIRFNYVKNNNNLRDLYIRCINLGGQKEEIYNETDSSEIRRAFRLAGENI